MTWLPGSVYTNELYSYLHEISHQYCHNDIPIADSYYAVLVRATGTLTALQADYSNFPLAKQIPSLNIQAKSIPQSSIPNRQSNNLNLVKREASAPAARKKDTITCILCGDSHLAHRCLLTRKIRDKELIAPNDFCIKHCGKKGETCKDKCYLFKKLNGKVIDLTCGKKDHGLRHFLLCQHETCRKHSEAYWQRRKARREIVHLLVVEDVDFSDIENLDQSLDEMDEKIECSDVYVVQNLFLPIMIVSETVGTRSNLQTFFLMEKVLVNLPLKEAKNNPTEIIIVYDSGSGRTVGNHIEYLDQSKEQRFTNLILSSLNGIDKSQKRVCEISILSNTKKSCHLDVIVPRDNIPQPPPQSMSKFKSTDYRSSYNNRWILDITEEDLNSLPIVLLGLSDIRMFPCPIDKECVNQKLLRKFPHLQFYDSKITGKRMVAGVAIGEITESETISNNSTHSNVLIYDYQEVPDNDTCDTVKDYAIQVNYNLESIPDNETLNIITIDSSIDTIENSEIETIGDIISRTEIETDDESKKLIESILQRDEVEHAGKDEATILLVKQLQSDSENEAKSEEPYEYDETEFPTLNPK